MDPTLSPAAADMDRGSLLVAMAETCEAAGPPRSERARDALTRLFLTLASGADPQARVRLSERVAQGAWPPRELAVALADDAAIEVAQPVIAASPALGWDDLLRLIDRSPEHAVEVARRPTLPPPVSRALALRDDPMTLAALASNERSDLPADVIDRLVESSRRLVAVRAPVSRRRELSATQAERMSGWVGPSLHSALAERFTLGEPAPGSEVDQDEMETRLVGKLESAGQLRPGYLLRTLREGKLSLFEAALASLGGFARQDVRRAIASDRPELLALACAGVGIDRSVWPTLLGLVRDLNGGQPAGGTEAALTAALSARGDAAAQAFRSGVASL